MIGLLFMAGISVWLAVVIYLCKRIPRWLGMARFTKAAQFLLFPVLLILPIADELIGRWQFKKLCEREAVVALSSDWQGVKRARNASGSIINLNGYTIRIREWSVKYVDIDTGRPFLEYKGFHHSGGVLMDRLGLGLGKSISCWPPNDSHVLNSVNIDQLLKQGK